MVLESTGANAVFLVARVLFGGVLAFMGLNHFTDTEAMAGYAEAKGVPAAGLMVPLTGGQLLFGGLGIVLGVFPVLAAGAIAVFLLVSAVSMHDFWAVPDDQAQDEMVQFLKNVALTGCALTLLAVGGQSWAYSVGLGLF